MTRQRTLFMGFIAALCMLFSGVLFGSENDLGAEQWYRESYAPLWADDPQGNVGAAAAFYAATLTIHSQDGGLSVVNTSEWIRDSVTGWIAEGWLTSDLAGLEAQEINSTTFSFTTRWQDHYRDQDSEYSCGWYLVDRVDGEWKISGYAESECKE